MYTILEYGFLSWWKFILVFLVVCSMMILSNRFHLFNKHNWKNSIGYHLFFIIMIAILLVCFILVKPLINFLLVLVIFGFFYKNIFGYVKSIFSFYFSGICLLYTSPSPRDRQKSRMPSSA